MKLKRITALAIVLALVAGTMPMVAMAATLDSKIYYWDSAAFTDTAQDEITAALSGKGYVLVNKATADIASAVDISNVTLILNGVGITIASGGSLKVKELYTLGSATVNIQDGGKLTVGGAEFAGGIAFERNAATDDALTSDDQSPATLTAGADTITLTGNATVKGYSQKTGSSLVASTHELTFEGTNNISQTIISSGKLIVGGGNTTIDSSSESITGNVTVTSGSLNVKKALAAIKSLEVGSNGTVNLSANVTIADGGVAAIFGTVNISGSGAKLVLGAVSILSGKMNVNNNGTLDLNGKVLGIPGTLYFETSATLKTNGDTATLALGDAGRLWLAYPASKIDARADINVTGQKGAYIYSEDWDTFKRFIKNPGVYTGYYDYYFARDYSYGDSIISNSPTLSPSSSTYGGAGDFIIFSSGFYNNFDPDKSLYANNVKLTAGQDYSYSDRSGYVMFTVFESTMRQYSGNVVFKATFKNGTSASAAVNVNGLYVPPELDISAPKTGARESALGFVLLTFTAVALFAAKKVRSFN